MKKFYKENRVFVILMGIALICIAIICGMMLWYVVNSSTKDAYGNRLDGIGDVKIEKKRVTEMESSISEMEHVQEVTINIHGKIINFNIDFDNETTSDEVKNVAIKCLEYFEEDYRNYYDMQFLFTKSDSEDSEEKFPVLGYIKAGKTTITWSNNME